MGEAHVIADFRQHGFMADVARPATKAGVHLPAKYDLVKIGMNWKLGCAGRKPGETANVRHRRPPDG
jgi:hypothetical protein